MNTNLHAKPGIGATRRTIRRNARRLLNWVPVLILSGWTSGLQASLLQTQTIQLQAGWNAVFIEVVPTNTRPEVVFSQLPLDSAWAFQGKLTSADFIQDISETGWNTERWAFFVPTNRDESIGNRLAAVLGNQPYLIRLTNAATLTITGSPSLRRIDWAPDAYNIASFPLDPSAPPTFKTFFSPSPAHFNATTGQLQPIYRLNGSGQWTLVTATDSMRAGEAYWVFCKGGSDYQGPLVLRLDTGNGLEFGDSLDVENLGLANASSSSATVKLTDVGAAGANPLFYESFDPNTGTTWPSLPSPMTLSLSGGTNVTLHVAIRRTLFAGTNYETVLSINNGAGVRYLLPVTAQISPQSALAASTDPNQQAQGYAGLWFGEATITGVSMAHSGNLVTNGFDSQGRPLVIERVGFDPTPRPVKAPAVLRLLVHVDTNGVTRLLKEVIQMWKDGTTTTDNNGLTVQVTPGRPVLLTDSTLIPQYSGIAPRDQSLVGRRFSSAAFDFPGLSLPMAGTFAVNQTVTVTNFLDKSWPTNPFRHKYHPDHQAQNSYDVTRVISLQVQPPGTNSPPEYGHHLLQGGYSEIVSGLDRTNIFAAGTFSLRRISEVGVLNQ